MNIIKTISALSIYLISQNLSAEDFRVLDLGPYTVESGAPWIQIITDQDQWYEFYYQRLLDCPSINASETLEPDPCALPEPSVDFETEMVVVGGLGAKPTSDFKILISHVSLSDIGEQVIQVVDIEPCLGLTVIDYPMAAVVISNTSRPIHVNVEYAKEKCG